MLASAGIRRRPYDLLMHFNGADESTLFASSGIRPLSIDAIDGAEIDTAQSVFGGSSGHFPGAGSHILIPYDDALSFEGSEWTIDFRVRPDSFGGIRTLIDLRGNNPSFDAGWGFYIDAAGVLCLYDGVTNTNFESGPALTSGAWQHVRVTRDAGGVIRFFTGGALHGTTLSLNMSPTQASGIRVGGQNDDTNWFVGHVDELMMLKGACLSTSTFTPPTHTY